jgi:vacuolar-type H+-ATPase subunit H
MTARAVPASSQTTVEALKRVKAAETEWEAKVTEARGHRDAALRRMREETDATIQAAVAEAERERASAVQAARAAAETEAAQILADGDHAAAAASHEDPKALAAKRAAILAAVLDGFGPD